ncbi:MAG: MBL fold metallo-hydrolase [Gammaproteobacteria bacterium]
MKNYYKILIAVMLIAVTSIGFTDFNDQDFSKISLKKIKITDSIYMLQGVNGFAGGNLAVSIGEDGTLMVDDQLSPMNEKIIAALDGMQGSKPKFVLNTHWHGDHTGGNAIFGKDATIIAHHNVRKRVSTDQHGHFGKTPASPKQAWPVITFDDSLSIHFNGEEIRFLHYPNGHTDGDGVVYFVGSNVVHMGDLLFTDVFPFIDLDTGGNVFNYAENLQAIMEWLPKDVKIIPGHGELTDIEGIEKTHNMMLETSMYVMEKVSQGNTLEQIQAEGLPEEWKSWGNGFVNEEFWISLIINSHEP